MAYVRRSALFLLLSACTTFGSVEGPTPVDDASAPQPTVSPTAPPPTPTDGAVPRADGALPEGAFCDRMSGTFTACCDYRPGDMPATVYTATGTAVAAVTEKDVDARVGGGLLNLGLVAATGTWLAKLPSTAPGTGFSLRLHVEKIDSMDPITIVRFDRTGAERCTLRASTGHLALLCSANPLGTVDIDAPYVATVTERGLTVGGKTIAASIDRLLSISYGLERDLGSQATTPPSISFRSMLLQ